MARISLFSRPDTTNVSGPSALDLYKKIWDADPDNFQKSPAPVFPSQAQGKCGDLQVTCLVHPTRIDFNLSPVLSQGVLPQPVLQLIENTAQLHAELQRITNVLTNGSIQTPSVGVALFLQFVVPQPSFKEANSRLMSIIPERYRTKLTDEEDFVFQVNRPQASTQVKGVRLNFITKWSVERAKVVTFALPPQAGSVIGQPQMLTPISTDFIVPSIAFDINNSPYTPDADLTVEQLSLLLREGLSRIEQLQHEFGLNLPGFNHVSVAI